MKYKKMPDYSKGKIYKLVSNHSDDVYYGSTINPLYKRLGAHKSAYMRYNNDGKGSYVSSFEIVKYDDVKIILVKEYSCENKHQLERKERKYIEKYQCVNKVVPTRSQICQHNKQRSKCKDCGGSEICQHDRQQSHCRDCNGSQICEHHKRQSYCKDCEGSYTLIVQCSICNKILRKSSLKKHINKQH